MRARHFYRIIMALICLGIQSAYGILTMYNNADPFPFYSTVDPYLFISVCERNKIKCYDEECCPSYFRLAFSPYGQNASLSWDLSKNTANLGNLKGNWNMIALFYDKDTAKTLESVLDLDVTACLETSSGSEITSLNLIIDPAATDPKKQFGFFDVQGKYTKAGCRFEAEIRIYKALSLIVETGVAHIHVKPTFVDLTCAAAGQNCPVLDCPGSCPKPIVDPNSGNTDNCIQAGCCVDYASCACKTEVIDNLMKQRNLVATTLGQSLDPFDATSMEDLQLILNFAPMFPVNQNQDTRWPFFIFTPFVSAGVTCPISKTYNHNRLFAVPFSNDGHWAFGGRAGFSADFVDTISIGSSVGITGFSAKTHTQYPFPTQTLQTGIFPELGTVRIKPGLNLSVEAYMNAYHFLYDLSFYFQYILVNHDEDKFDDFKVTDGGTVQPLLSKLRDESAWQFQAVNFAFNYDISRNLLIGLGFQIPVAGRNVYRSTTVMGTLQVTY